MKLGTREVAVATTLLAALAMPVCMTGQPNQETNKAHTRYNFIDLGTSAHPCRERRDKTVAEPDYRR